MGRDCCLFMNIYWCFIDCRGWSMKSKIKWYLEIFAKWNRKYILKDTLETITLSRFRGKT